MAEEMKHEDELQDQIQIDENVEPVEEDLDKHEESDELKWKDVYEKIAGIVNRLDDFEKWVNEAIGGLDKASADEAKDASDDDVYEEDEVSAMDDEFYAKQAAYLREGGY